MYNKEKIMKSILLLVISCLVVGGCAWINEKLGWENDNPLEEFLEEVIENETGLDIDLTPDDEN